MSDESAFVDVVRRLVDHRVRFVIVGVGGANYYARSAGEIFSTLDRDLFLPIDSRNLLNAWSVARDLNYILWSGDEPLGEPVDQWLADRVVSLRATTTAIHSGGVQIDFMLDMKAFDFETVWTARRTFRIDDVEIPVARLSHIVESKTHANRPKDRQFLATWEERLRRLIDEEE